MIPDETTRQERSNLKHQMQLQIWKVSIISKTYKVLNFKM